ncbi:hypothetical protein SISSUDRAFT_1028503 [Sistotremastrum suecicum HHB10207 ss-3]|uniref:FAD/NAD(P)-binding domain-containing protein n=1 Tax=Sistotremastrum suecicum HHB10207 ss-3 TaxID=1314776 RepID=A0A165XPM3_9AGAM|nr:hypothetical protein SISSUDRAFT_1028503 [Sistotremastrum suecicum HHB10207 ss-3]
MAILGPVSLWRSLLPGSRKKKIAEFTALNDLAGLGRPRNGNLIDGTALIAGGSISGLLTARVCSSHFSRVLVVEPESWASTADGRSHAARFPKGENQKRSNPRTRIPQYIAPHNYQVFTYLALKEMFPEFEAQSLKIDLNTIVPCNLQFHPSGKHVRSPVDFYNGTLPKFLAITRHGYETLLRNLLKLTCPNVEFVVGTVTGLNVGRHPDRDSTQHIIESVTIRSQEGLKITEPAAVVVDCTGSSTAAIKWLSVLPDPVIVPKQVHDPKMRYTNCEYIVDPAIMEKVDFPGGYANASMIYLFHPDYRMEHRTLLIWKREHNALQFVCGGWDLTDRPRSIADLRNFMRRIKSAEPLPNYLFQIMDALEDNECDRSATYNDIRASPSHFVKYHEIVERLPTNLIAIGDSVIKLNPVKGQGCTKAMIGAVTLAAVLHECDQIPHAKYAQRILPPSFGKIFWSRQNKRTKSIWEQFKHEDYGWNTTIPAEGEDLSQGAFMRWYTRNLFSVASKNDDVAAVVYNCAMFLAPGSDVLAPGIVLRVVWAGVKVVFSVYHEQPYLLNHFYRSILASLGDVPIQDEVEAY